MSASGRRRRSGRPRASSPTSTSTTHQPHVAVAADPRARPRPSRPVPRRGDTSGAPGDRLVLFDGLPLYPRRRLVLDAERLRAQLGRTDAGSTARAALRADLERDGSSSSPPPLGLLPVFACDSPGGGQLLSNSVLALRLLAGLRGAGPAGRQLAARARLDGGRQDAHRGHPRAAGRQPDHGLGRRRWRSNSGSAPAQLAARNGGSPDARALAERLVESARGLSALGRSGVPADGRPRLAPLPGRAASGRRGGRAATRSPPPVARTWRWPATSPPAWGLPSLGGRHDDLWQADGGDLARGFVFQNDGLTTFEQIADHPSQLLPVRSLGAKVSGIGGEIARAGSRADHGARGRHPPDRRPPPPPAAAARAQGARPEGRGQAGGRRAHARAPARVRGRPPGRGLARARHRPDLLRVRADGTLGSNRRAARGGHGGSVQSLLLAARSSPRPLPRAVATGSPSGCTTG